MDTESTRELPKDETDVQSMIPARKNAQVLSYLYPLAVTVASGYFIAPYISTITRYGFPYFYGHITGTAPEDLGYLEYGSIYLPMREHATDFAYQNAYTISVTAGLVGYGLVRLSYFATKSVVSNTYHAVSSIGRSLFSFFSNQDDEAAEEEMEPQTSPESY